MVVRLSPAHADNALLVAVVRDSATLIGYQVIRRAPWEYTGKLVVGADVTYRKLAALTTALKQNAKTYGATMLTYPWLLDEPSLRRVVWLTRGCPRSAGTVQCTLSSRCRAQPQQAGDGGAGAAAGGQRMPRCRQYGCEKCSGKNTMCTQEQRQAWCTQHGWDARWPRQLGAGLGDARWAEAEQVQAPRALRARANQLLGAPRRLSCIIFYFRQFALIANLLPIGRTGRAHGASVHSRQKRQDMYAQTHIFHMH